MVYATVYVIWSGMVGRWGWRGPRGLVEGSQIVSERVSQGFVRVIIVGELWGGWDECRGSVEEKVNCGSLEIYERTMLEYRISRPKDTSAASMTVRTSMGLNREPDVIRVWRESVIVIMTSKIPRPPLFRCAL
jgi:hypothetical protein